MLAISPRLSTFLDASRWLAAAGVLLEHTRILVFEQHPLGETRVSLVRDAFYFATGFGRIAVVVFFVLSGFLVGGEVLRSFGNGAFSWRNYAIKRATRLYPVYLFSLGAGGAFDWIGVHFANFGGIYTAGASFPGLDFSIQGRLSTSVLAHNLFFLQGLRSPPFGSNQPLWSIAFEAWYYLLFPLLIWPAFRRDAPILVRIMTLAAALAVIVFIRGEMLLYFAVWLAGLLPHLAASRIRVSWGAAFTFFGLLLVVARLNSPWLSTPFLTYMALALAFALCIIGVARSDSGLLPYARLHRSLASFSYSLYASHWPLLVLIAASSERIWSWGLRMAPSLGVFAFWASLAVLCYGWAWCIAQCTEFRVQHLRSGLLGILGEREARSMLAR